MLKFVPQVSPYFGTQTLKSETVHVWIFSLLGLQVKQQELTQKLK